MTSEVKLPAKLDMPAAIKLVEDLRNISGDIKIDGAEVKNLGSLCLQALIAASKHAHSNGHAFSFTAISERMKNQMAMMGATPEKLMEGKL